MEKRKGLLENLFEKSKAFGKNVAPELQEEYKADLAAKQSAREEKKQAVPKILAMGKEKVAKEVAEDPDARAKNKEQLEEFKKLEEKYMNTKPFTAEVARKLNSLRATISRLEPYAGGRKRRRTTKRHAKKKHRKTRKH